MYTPAKTSSLSTTYLGCQRLISRMFQGRSSVLAFLPNFFFRALLWEHFSRAVFVGDVSRHDQMERECSEKRPWERHRVRIRVPFRPVYYPSAVSPVVGVLPFWNNSVFQQTLTTLKWEGFALPECGVWGAKAESNREKIWMLAYASCGFSVPCSHNSYCSVSDCIVMLSLWKKCSRNWIRICAALIGFCISVGLYFLVGGKQAYTFRHNVLLVLTSAELKCYPFHLFGNWHIFISRSTQRFPITKEWKINTCNSLWMKRLMEGVS